MEIPSIKVFNGQRFVTPKRFHARKDGKWELAKRVQRRSELGWVPHTGNMHAWGYPFFGLGDDEPMEPVLTPMWGAHKQWKQVLLVWGGTLGITVDGDLYSWGNDASNETGVLGTPQPMRSLSPQKISSLKWKHIAGRSWSALGITTGGDMYGWGGNNDGQLGTGDRTRRFTPTKISGNLKWDSVSINSNHALGITTDGDLYSWGSSFEGRLGLPIDINEIRYVLVPTKVDTRKWAKVFAGGHHSLGITTSGDLYAWGWGEHGQLGTGDKNNRLTPTKIGSSKWIDISGGDWNSYGIDANGHIYRWGNGAPDEIDIVTPTRLSADVWVKISGIRGFFGAIKADGGVYMCGNNGSGQLGNGDTVYRNQLTKISSSLKYSDIDTSDGGTVALIRP